MIKLIFKKVKNYWNKLGSEVSLQGKLIMMIGLPGTGKSYQALKIVFI
jgi:hypothetical protein